MIAAADGRALHNDRGACLQTKLPFVTVSGPGFLVQVVVAAAFTSWSGLLGRRPWKYSQARQKKSAVVGSRRGAVLWSFGGCT